MIDDPPRVYWQERRLMPFVIAAQWNAKPGQEDSVLGLLRTMAGLARNEPGCLLFRVHRSVDDPRTFFLYELYDTQEALAAHSQTAHFKRYVLGDALNRLESRRREIYELVDAEPGGAPRATDGAQR
jgi:quinol monooxygenase YgiN